MRISLLLTPLLVSSVAAFVAPPRITPRSAAIRTNANQKLAASRPISIADSLENVFGPIKKPGLASRIIRVANHAPAVLSLSFFGLVSMSSMMPGVMSVKPTLASVLTQGVGPTTNKLFAEYFPTLVTPPGLIFLIWPTIAVVQIATLLYSALQPMKNEVLTQDNLTALAISNLAATWWLISSSQTAPGVLTLSSFLILPLVPLFSGLPLRKETDDPTALNFKNCIFQLFSSFTIIASFLALAVELQHGGRLLPKLPAEAAASVFLGLYYLVVSMKKKSKVKKVVQAGAITGIALKRIQEGMIGGAAGVGKLFLSVSFLGTLVVAIKAINRLLKEN
jgi:hypothetical protein